MSGVEVATVRVKRLHAFAGTAIVWRLLVDGQQAAEIGSGDSCEFAVYPGRHVLEVRPSAWAKADSLVFAVEGGQTFDFVVKPKSGGIRGGAQIAPGPSPQQVFGNPPRQPDAELRVRDRGADLHPLE